MTKPGNERPKPSPIAPTLRTRSLGLARTVRLLSAQIDQGGREALWLLARLSN